MKILILKPSSLGDVVQALPVLRLLKHHFPTGEFHWWIESGLAPLLEYDPDLSGLFRFERRRWSSPFRWAGLLKSVRAMRRERFDYIIDLQGLSRSALIAWLANGKTIIGLDNPREGTREGAQGLYDLRARRSPDGTPAVDRYLAVLDVLGVPVHWKFDWLPARRAVADQLRTKWPLRPGRWILLQPGARWDNKRWPAHYFADVVRRLSRQYVDLNFAILGSQADQELARTILPACADRCLDLTGRTSLPEMVEWIRLSDLVITNDTGPMHVAAALRKPLVAIFGPTNPASTGPHGQRSAVVQAQSLPCVPCLKRDCMYVEPLACLHTITPDHVHQLACHRLDLSDGTVQGDPDALAGTGRAEEHA